MFLALQELKKEKARFLLIISIFALISYLVYFLTGLAYGLAVDNRTAVDQWNAKQIVLANGSNNNISSSMIDQDVFAEDLDGVDYEFVNLSRSAAYINGNQSADNTIDIALIGIYPDSDKFPELAEGEAIGESREAIASISFREEMGLEIGDELKLSMNGSVFKIVGFTKDYKFNVSPVIYTRLEEAASSALLYRAVDSADEDSDSAQDSDAVSGPTANIPERVSAALIYSDDDLSYLEDSYDVVAISDFINDIPGYYAQLLTFGLMIGFLIVIASIVLGVFLYIITIQKKQTFGIMKIQGISNLYIGRSVVVQTLLISLIGVGVGLLLTYLTDLFLPKSVPFRENLLFFGAITIIMMVTAQIGAVFSVKSVSKVDPLSVI